MITLPLNIVSARWTTERWTTERVLFMNDGRAGAMEMVESMICAPSPEDLDLAVETPSNYRWGFADVGGIEIVKGN